MCGIFGGFSHYLNESEVDNIRTLGAISYPRGIDSVGMAIAHKKSAKSSTHEYFMDKVVSDPWGYLYHPATTKLLRKTNNIKTIIGHVRSATVGEVTRDNAHPYQVGNIIGVHNGTINSLRTQGTTDSHVLYRKIAEFGAKVAINSLTDGTYALVWFDKSNNTINFARNEQRPLWLMSSKSGGTTYFASERIFLNYIDARENTPFDDPFMLEAGIIHTFKIDSGYTYSKEPLKGTDENPFKRMYPEINYDDFIENIKEVETPPKQEVLSLPPPSAEAIDKDKEQVRSMSVLNPHRTVRDFNFSIARHKLTKPGKPPSVIPDLILTSTKESIDPATMLFPTVTKQGSTDLFPYSCTVNHNYKRIYYKDFNGHLVDPFDILTLLEDGCLMTKRKAAIWERLFWVSDLEFVTYEEKDDDYVKEYLTLCNNKSLVEGSLVYCSPLAYKTFNKGIN